ATVSAARAIEIEVDTDGAVTRADILPKKWRQIWPESLSPDFFNAIRAQYREQRREAAALRATVL
ncbi:DNA-binding transcriptional regulator YdaS (Cro superfamily), partial [Oxalobacteraceae bacterium GrIS 1.11]